MSTSRSRLLSVIIIGWDNKHASQAILHSTKAHGYFYCEKQTDLALPCRKHAETFTFYLTHSCAEFLTWDVKIFVVWILNPTGYKESLYFQKNKMSKNSDFTRKFWQSTSFKWRLKLTTILQDNQPLKWNSALDVFGPMSSGLNSCSECAVN